MNRMQPAKISDPIHAECAHEPVLIAEHLRKEFSLQKMSLFDKPRRVQAVADVSLTLYAGKALALVGESGSGKTTVARILAGMYQPTSGTIRLRDKILNSQNTRNVKEYHRQVQLIFQDPFASLNPVHTVLYHLSRPLRIYGHAHTSAEIEEQVMILLEKVNLTPASQFMQKYPHQLSGGQRQRVAIARALAVQPTVLLADEPVSMLDVSIRLEILNLLRHLKESEHLGLLFITHDIASARYITEECLVMYAGQVIEGGPTDTMIQQPQHPYTQLLLASAPDPDRLQRRRNASTQDSSGLQTRSSFAVAQHIRGEPPSLINPPTGCRFHPRCPVAMSICSEQFPEKSAIVQGQWSHCHLHVASKA